ncbi:MAG: T9SS type A sorting domain-containing protein [Chitinophagales bacterium]|nr:T9SS type A sorting domain-containing protein [Chitinophagales bacterium]MDW8392732.1 T9SS type A sorting domain-containing protein [Chitinophagales bacterium]
MSRLGVAAVWGLLYVPVALTAQVVTGLKAEYRHGQIFIIWNNIPGVDSGFYYVYCNPYPITASNIQTSTYLGRVPYNFSFDFRLTQSIADNVPRRLVINDSPRQPVRFDQNVFVMTCTENNQTTYFAVRCDYGNTSPNWMVIPGANSLEAGFGVKQVVAPVRAYLQEANVNFPGSNNGEKMDVYIHYGGNRSTIYYPEMSNEGCLAFHFGIIKSGPVNGKNAGFLKFHGGNGNFVNNAIGVVIDSSWKISFDDWIPNFNFSSSGYHTRWFGHHEKFDVYKATVLDPPPLSGVVKAYTLRRIRWELDWILSRWPNAIDSNRLYLIGSSQGTAAVWSQALVYPHRYACGSATDGKLNMNAGEDSNPQCKYNEGGTARTETRILWGHEDQNNLFTDLPDPNNPGAMLRIYDVTNVGYMMALHQNRGIPYMQALNGKEDVNTCWEEKIAVYDAANQNRTGSVFFWDLRAHGGSGNKEWKPLNIKNMLRYATNKSMPAFSFCSCNGNPGDTYNPTPPYYDGDPVGAINGNVDWNDKTLIDTDTMWQVQLFAFQQQLLSGSYYPGVMPDACVADVTIRRPQQFKGFAAGTELCWTNVYPNGSQSGTVIVEYNGTEAKPITIPAVQISTGISTLTVKLCDGQFERQAYRQAAPISLQAFAAHGDILGTTVISDAETGHLYLQDALGRVLKKQTIAGTAQATPFRFAAHDLPAGIYFVHLKVKDQMQVKRVVIP